MLLDPVVVVTTVGVSAHVKQSVTMVVTVVVLFCVDDWCVTGGKEDGPGREWLSHVQVFAGEPGHDVTVGVTVTTYRR